MNNSKSVIILKGQKAVLNVTYNFQRIGPLSRHFLFQAVRSRT